MCKSCESKLRVRSFESGLGRDNKKTGVGGENRAEEDLPRDPCSAIRLIR